MTVVRRLLPALGDDRGALAPALPILALMFMLLAGLIIDSSRQLTARARAVAYAEEAARAGAEAVDPGSNPLAVDESAAQRAVRQYCGTVRQTEQNLTCGAPSFSVNDTVVTVHTTITIDTGMLGLVGVANLDASGDGRARVLIGVTEGDAQ